LKLVTPAEEDPWNLKNLPSNINQLSLSMQHFCLGMKHSYEYATNVRELEQFKTLRCLLVEDATVYSKHVVTYSKIVCQEVMTISDLITSMENLTDFTDNVDYLADETEKILSALQFVSVLNMKSLENAHRLRVFLQLQEEQTKKYKLVKDELKKDELPLTGLPKTKEEIKQLIINYNGRESEVIAWVLVSNVIVPALKVYIEAIEKVVIILCQFEIREKELKKKI